MKSREIGKKLWNISNTENLKNSLHLIGNADLECESAMTNETEAELMTSWEGGASEVFVNKSGFLSQSVVTMGDESLDVVL